MQKPVYENYWLVRVDGKGLITKRIATGSRDNMKLAFIKENCDPKKYRVYKMHSYFSDDVTGIPRLSSGGRGDD